MNIFLYIILGILYNTAYILLFFNNTEFIGLALLLVAHTTASVLMITDVYVGNSAKTYTEDLYTIDIPKKLFCEVFALGKCEDIKIPVSHFITFIMVLQFVSIVVIITAISKIYFKRVINGDTIDFPDRVRSNLFYYEAWFLFGTVNAFRLLGIADMAVYFQNNKKRVKEFLAGFSLETTLVAIYLIYLSYVVFNDLNAVIL